MFGRRSNACLFCYREESFLRTTVTGKCAACYGSGVNLQINSPEPKCRPCRGTGVCPTCGGTARNDRRKPLPDIPASTS
jgi:hypothetical protein